MTSKSKKDKKKKKQKEEVSEKNSVIENNDSEKKNEIFSLLDDIDAESLEKTRKTEEILKEGIKKTVKSKKEHRKKEDEFSFRNVKKNIDDLLKIKNELQNNEEFDKSIIISKKIINIASRANLIERVKKENQYINLINEKLNANKEKRLQLPILKQIDGLKELKEDFLTKEKYYEANKISNRIIKIAHRAKLRSIMEQEDQSIILSQMKMEEKYAKIDVSDRINGLQEIKNDNEINGKYDDAINISKKIIAIAKIKNLGDLIQKEEKFIFSIKEKIKKKPSNLEIIDKIEGLKIIKQAHFIKSEFERAIKISKKILKFANIAKLEIIIKEEQDSIDIMQEKLDMEKSILNIMDEFSSIKLEYEVLISHNDIEEAHKLLENFYDKYAEYTQIFATPEINKLITEDKKTWIKYNVEKSEDRKETDKKIKQKQKDLEVEQARIKEEKEKIAIEAIKFHEEKKKEKMVEDKVKSAIKEDREQLSVDITQFMEEKVQYQQKIMELEEEREKIEEERREIEEEKKKIEQDKHIVEEEKEKIEWEKVKLEEVRDEIKAFKEEKEKFLLEKDEFEKEKQKVNDIKKKLMEL